MGFGYLINLRVPNHYGYLKRIDVVVQNTSDDLKSYYHSLNNTFTVFLKSTQILIEDKSGFFKAISSAFYEATLKME